MAGLNGLTHHRVNQLDTIVLRGVVASSNHNSNPLSAKLLRPQACKQAHCKNNGVEEVTAQPDWSEQVGVNKRMIAGF